MLQYRLPLFDTTRNMIGEASIELKKLDERSSLFAFSLGSGLEIRRTLEPGSLEVFSLFDFGLLLSEIQKAPPYTIRYERFGIEKSFEPALISSCTLFDDFWVLINPNLPEPYSWLRSIDFLSMGPDPVSW